VGATYWLYTVWHQLPKEEISNSIAGMALGARKGMADVAEGFTPKGVYPLATKLALAVSHLVFETRNPGVCLKLSDASHLVSKAVKSLALVPLFVSSGVPLESAPNMAKVIAEQLQTIKTINSTLIPSHAGPKISIAEENEVFASAYKQLYVALEFYQSNSSKVPLPYPNKLVPLIKTQLAQIQALPAVLRLTPLPVKKVASTAKTLTSAVAGMRNLFLDHKVDFEEDEVHWKNLLTVLDGAVHFAIQVLLSTACVLIENKMSTSGHIAFAVRGVAFCSAVIIDSFCLDL